MTRKKLISTQLCCALVVLIIVSALSAEEIQLKNGSKISGTIVGVEGGIFQVKTDYGDVRIPRSDMVSVSFVDQGPADAETKKEPPIVNESLVGTAYANHTANFDLVVPDGWLLAPELRKGQPDIIAALKSPDEAQFLVVTPEKFAGTLTTYEVFCETQYQTKFQDYKRLEKTDIQLDGRPGMRIVFQGVAPSNRISLKFLVYIVQYEDQMIRLSFLTLEPLFTDSVPAFEKIAHSYQRHKPASVAELGIPAPEIE
jgi:hypothetical protein